MAPCSLKQLLEVVSALTEPRNARNKFTKYAIEFCGILFTVAEVVSFNWKHFV